MKNVKVKKEGGMTVLVDAVEPLPPFNDTELCPEWQAEMEGKIAAIILGNTTADEKVAGEVSRGILKQVLWKFRKDLFKVEKDPKTFVIPAEVYSDDHKVEAKFDALPWFREASVGAILNLASEDWGAGDASDAVALALEETDPDIAKVFLYLSFGPKDFGEDVGFTCHVNANRAMKWLKKNRPVVFKKIEEES